MRIIHLCTFFGEEFVKVFGPFYVVVYFLIVE